MASKKSHLTRAQINYRARALASITDAVTRVVCTMIHACIWLGAFWFIYSVVHDLAGKDTKAEFFLKAVTDLKAPQWLGAIFGAGGIAWGVKERRFRKKTVNRLQQRVQGFEKMLDTGRSSSGLPETGNSRTGDAP